MPVATIQFNACPKLPLSDAKRLDFKTAVQAELETLDPTRIRFEADWMNEDVDADLSTHQVPEDDIKAVLIGKLGRIDAGFTIGALAGLCYYYIDNMRICYHCYTFNDNSGVVTVTYHDGTGNVTVPIHICLSYETSPIW